MALKVFFPVKSILKPQPSLFDPGNTDTIYEYYLLENLSSGLVKDDVKSITGYAPSLAISWEQTNSKTWVFRLRPNLKWSNGELVTKDELNWYFERLRTVQTRHIVYLKELNRVLISEAQSQYTVTLEFNHDVGEGILHELSLADAGLLRASNLTEGWAVTSGAYHVSSFDHVKGLLTLNANISAVWAGENFPEQVVLFDVVSKEEVPKLFSDKNADIVTRSGLFFSPWWLELQKSAPHELVGAPNSTWYLGFSSSSAMSSDAGLRHSASAFFRNVVSKFEGIDELRPENQIIPFGQMGHLDDVHFSSAAHSLAGKKIRVLIYSQIRYMGNFIQVSETLAKAHGFELEFTEDAKSVYDLYIDAFRSNQKDQIGNWSFLFSGPMKQFKTDAQALISGIATARTEDEKETANKKLNAAVAAHDFIIPLFSSRPKVFYSDKVDLSLWSPFDLRLRFYDVRWK